MNRDETRALLHDAGITCDNVTDDQLKRLRRIIGKHLSRYRWRHPATASLFPE